jgi:glycosyltransferase involved in cell wall biosynthesis
LLPALLEHCLQQQSRQPDEIVVALSGCAAPGTIPDRVRLVHSEAPLTAGQNRNRAADAASGDLLIYQDADDIPHPQRTEIIAGLFEAYEIEHLMHGYVYAQGTRWSIGYPGSGSKKSDGPIELPPSSIEAAAARSAYRSEPASSTRVTNGEIAFVRAVLGVARWPERAGTGTDTEFNRLVYARFKRTVTTDLPLVIYRHHLSSFR